MKKILSVLFVAATLVLFSTVVSQAITIGFGSSVVDVTVGDSFSVNLTVSGLNDGFLPSLAEFDVDILYDTSQMSFTGYDLGTHLGDVSIFEAMDFSFGDLGGGVIDLAELSFLTAVELTPQFGAFDLATLYFDCFNIGSSLIEYDANDPFLFLGSESGFAFDVEIGGAVTVNQNDVAIPEPATMMLLGSGLIGLVLFKRKKV